MQTAMTPLAPQIDRYTFLLYLPTFIRQFLICRVQSTLLYMCGTDVFIVYADVFCKLAEMMKGKISIQIVIPVDIYLACAGSFVFASCLHKHVPTKLVCLVPNFAP